MGTVKFWKEGDLDLSSGDCLLVDGEFREFLPIIMDDIRPDDVEVFVCSSLDHGKRDILLVYMSMKNKSFEDCQIDREVLNFINSWQEFCYFTKSLDTDAATNVSKKLKPNNAGEFYLWRTRELLSILLRTTRIIGATLATPTPLGEIAHHNRCNDWWVHNSVFAQDLRLLKADVNETDFGNAEDFKTELLIILKTLERTIDPWAKADLGEAFAIAGQMMLWSARFWMSKGIPTIVVLLCHRALDCFMTSHAYDSDLIYLDGERLRYTSQRNFEKNRKSDVGLAGTLNELLRHGIWVRDKKSNSFLGELNKTRNQLVFTHGAYRCSADEANWAFNTTEKLVREFVVGPALKFDPMAAWAACISEDLIFRFERGFDENIEAI